MGRDNHEENPQNGALNLSGGGATDGELFQGQSQE